MDNRERFHRVMHYQPVDHPPLGIPGPWATTLKRWQAEGLPAGADLYEYFDVPPVRYRPVGIETILFPPFEEVLLEDRGEFIIKIDRAGVKVRNFKDEQSMPEHLEYPIKGRQSLPWLRERLNFDTPGRIKENWLSDALAHQGQGDPVFCNGGMYFAFLNEHMGTDALMLCYYDDGDFIHQVNDLLCRLCERALQTALGRLRLDFVGYHEDMAYKNGSMISAAMFREFMMPYYRRVQAIARPFGIDVHYLDSDGNIEELIPLWLECGINCLSPMEVAAGMDVVRLRKRFGRSLLMLGGFDKRILAAGRSQIVAELNRLRPLIEEGGYIPGIDHGVPPDVSWENVCCYVETLKSMFGMR